VLIVSRSKCVNTAPGVVLSVSDRPAFRLKGNCLLNLHTGRSLTESTIPDAVLIHFYLPTMSTVLLEKCNNKRFI